MVQRLLSLRKTRVPGRRNHHVEDLRHRIPAERSSAASDVVPHSPQTLVLSSTSTTSLGPKAPAAYRTWCLTPRKPLFFRPQAPRLSGQRRRRRTGRGASLPTNPYSFVRKHHVSRVQWDFDVMDVVPHPPASPYSFVRKHHVPRSGWADALTDVVLYPPQTLVPSSGSTTSPGPDGPTPALTWCSIPRNPLFLRRGAPRPRPRMGLEKEVRTNLPFDCTSFHFYSV